MSEEKQARRAQRRRRCLGVLCNYLEDLLLMGAGACFTAAAALWWGLPGALATAGGCLSLWAVLVARVKGGGKL